MKDHGSKRIINYDKDLPFEEFAELVWGYIKWYNVKYIAPVFEKKLWRAPTLSEKIDFDTASFLIEDIDRKCSCWPLITRTILKRWKLRSPKTLQQILVGDKIAIDAYPFDYHNRTLECISKICSDSLSWWDWGYFKVFQMKDPEIIFIIEDGCGFNYIQFTYYWWFYHLNNPLENLRLLDNKELDDDFLKDLKEKMEEWDKHNELIKYIIAHQDEYVSAQDGKKSHNIHWIANDLKNGNTYARESIEFCDKCGRPLLSIYHETSGINYSTYDVLICPDCKIDYWIDFSTLTSVVV